jgi:hypothetical protein
MEPGYGLHQNKRNIGATSYPTIRRRILEYLVEFLRRYARLSESNLVFPGFLLMRLQEFLDCLWQDVSELAGIGWDN